jgi:quercetin dioxygenase-like cupin family protein
MKAKWAAALAVVTLGGTALGFDYSGRAAVATPSSGVTSPLLVKAVVDALNLHAKSIPADDWGADIQTRGQTDLYVVENQFSPGGTTGWHSHPGPSLILVISGSVTNYASDDPRCAGVTYSAGQSFVDAGGSDVHMIRNNDTVEAETIAVQFIPHGDQRKIDEPVPANCTGV